MEKQQQNYQSDFDFVLRFTFQGAPTTFPSYDFRIDFWTDGAATYTASSIGGVQTNCENDNGLLRIVFDNHKLNVGDLRCKMYQYIDDARYPDGTKLVVSPTTLPIELVRGVAQLPTDAEVEIAANVFVVDAYETARRNGYNGTKDEFITAFVGIPTAVEQANEATQSAQAATEQCKEATSQCEAKTEQLIAEVERHLLWNNGN